MENSYVEANLWSPTTGTLSGLQYTINNNNAFSALASSNSGATAPANDQSAAAVKGQFWLNTSTTPNPLEYYDGANWTIVGWLDPTNHQWIANQAGGTGTIASAGTTDLGTVLNQVVTITCTTTITALGTTALAGAQYDLIFSGALTLTHNATSLILPNNGSNIVTSAGDSCRAIALGSGNWKITNYQTAAGTPLQSTASVTAQSLAASALAPNAPPNLRINASVATNALTLTVVGVNNATPSASNPIPVIFRDSTLANGDPVEVVINSALSMTIPAGATLGVSNSVISGVTNTPFRGWIVLFNSGGTPVLGVINCLSLSATALSVMALMEETLQSPTNGAGNSAQVFYSGAGVSSNSAFRILGYFEYASGLATPGSYATAPTKVQLFGPGMKKPGDVVQTQYNLTSTTSTTNQTAVSGSISPTSACNPIQASAEFNYVSNGVGGVETRISRGTGPTYFGNIWEFYSSFSGSEPGSGVNKGFDYPATTSSTTYYVYVLSYLGGSAGTFNNYGNSQMTLQEIMA